MQAFAFTISVSLERAWKEEGVEGISVLSSTAKGSYRGDRAGLFSEVHSKRKEATDKSYSEKNPACM